MLCGGGCCGVVSIVGGEVVGVVGLWGCLKKVSIRSLLVTCYLLLVTCYLLFVHHM